MPVFKGEFYPWVPNIADGGMGLMGLMGVGCGMCGFHGFCFDFLLWVLVHLQAHGGGGGGCCGSDRDGFIVGLQWGWVYCGGGGYNLVEGVVCVC